MINQMRYLLLITVCFLLSSTLIYAKHHREDTKPQPDNHYSKHQISVFNGFTVSMELSYTIGLNYEYRFSKIVGVGLLGQYISSLRKEGFAGISVLVHTSKRTKFIVAPLIVLEEKHRRDSKI